MCVQTAIAQIQADCQLDPTDRIMSHSRPPSGPSSPHLLETLLVLRKGDGLLIPSHLELWGGVAPVRGRSCPTRSFKLLPAAFTGDPERLARFEREAQLLAQLHHPNIASIFGLEESGGVRALVMELVEGPTLAERLEQGRVPPDESLSIARQIAEALEKAHERGIVHRSRCPASLSRTSSFSRSTRR